MKEIIDITPPTQEEIMLEGLKKAVEEHEKGLHLIDQKRYNEMQRALHLISEIVLDNDPDAKIECGFIESFKDVGYVEIKTCDLSVQGYEMETFREVVELATTFEAHPIKGNKMSCSLTFAGIMHKKT